MATTKAQLELDDDLVSLLRQDEQPLANAAKEMIVLELYRRGDISSGRAAALLGMARVDFIRFASNLGIPFFELTEGEWQAELDRLQAL